MNKNFSFHKTIGGSLRSNINEKVWDKVVHLYESEAFADSIRECFNYINPAIEQRYANPERTVYRVPHGSMIVEVYISETSFEVKAPFLTVEGAKLIPILRQVAQLNFHPLTLSRIELNENQLYFKYACPIQNGEPYKVYDVLREICINADNYDDEFISKFNASRIQEPNIFPYTSAQKEDAYTNIQLYIREAFEAYDFFENKRMTNFLWDVVVITLLKIDYYCTPQGTLRNEIEKTLSFLNSKEDYYKRLSSGKEFLKKLQAIDKATLEKDLYAIEVFVPYKFRTTLESVRNILKYAYETAEKEMKALDFTGATLTMEYGILNMFYNNNIEDRIAVLLTDAMKDAEGKPFADSAKILFDALKLIMTTDIYSTNFNVQAEQQSTNQQDSKGFFKKLFGG